MMNALEIVRRAEEDVGQWIAAHLGNLRDDREQMSQEIARLKRRLGRLEKRSAGTVETIQHEIRY